MTKIKAARKAKGLTVQEVAERCQLTAGTVSRIERGLMGTTPDTAKRLAEVLGLAPAEVIFVERAA